MLLDFLEKDPSDEFTRFALALEYRKLGRRDEAIGHLEVLVGIILGNLGLGCPMRYDRGHVTCTNLLCHVGGDYLVTVAEPVIDVSATGLTDIFALTKTRLWHYNGADWEELRLTIDDPLEVVATTDAVFVRSAYDMRVLLHFAGNSAP